MPDEPAHVSIDLAPGDEIEIVRDDCGCPVGDVCPDDGLFAGACPRRQPEPFPTQDTGHVR